MEVYQITCPLSNCRKPLRVPEAAFAKQMSCPHCNTRIGLSRNADGTPGTPEALGSRYRVPRMFLVPGFALLILSVASLFSNGYVALTCLRDPNFAVEQARLQVSALRNTERLAGPNDTQAKITDPTPQDLFAALAGQGARIAEQLHQDERLAQSWAPSVGPIHWAFVGVSTLMFLGAVAILTGRFYWLAWLGSIAAILNLNNACCMPGAIVGIWAMLMLARDEGRAHFKRNRPTPSPASGTP
jgi:hypothetical protein